MGIYSTTGVERGPTTGGETCAMVYNANGEPKFEVPTEGIADGAVTTAKLADNSVTNAKLRDSGALSVIGRSANSSGDPADISATASTYRYLTPNGGTTLGFSTVDPRGIAFHGCSASEIANQSLTTATITQCSLTDADIEDSDAYHSTSTNTYRITIPSGLGGMYIFQAQAGFAANAVGTRYIFLEHNGTGTYGSGTGIATVTVPATPAGTAVIHAGSRPVRMTAGDTVDMFVQQTSGGDLDRTSAAFGCYVISA